MTQHDVNLRGLFLQSVISRCSEPGAVTLVGALSQSVDQTGKSDFMIYTLPKTFENTEKGSVLFFEVFLDCVLTN